MGSSNDNNLQSSCHSKLTSDIDRYKYINVKPQFLSVILVRQYDPTPGCASQEGGHVTNPILTASVV